MRRSEHFRLLVLVSVLTLWSWVVQGQDSAQLEARLETLREDIRQIQLRLDQDLVRRDELSAALSETERAVAAAELTRRDTQTRLDSTTSEIVRLEAGIASAESEVAMVGQRFGQQLRLAHQQGGQSRLQLLLNQDDPRRLSRHMAYHGYLSRARVRLLLELQSLLSAMAEDHQTLAHEQRRLATLQDQQAEALALLEAARLDRAVALGDLRTRIETQGAALAALERDAAELEALIEQLARALEDIPMDVEVPAISELQGQLPRPVDGRMVHRFGDPRSGEVRWNGWLIAASGGSEVRAIAHGRVAYADWLRGYGMLLIIDHGDGVMSLYGHNESLLRQVGDWVAPGDAIATVGQSGGTAEPGLYFEMRRDGRPVNPERWLIRQ